jgi:PPK2 family polyphosphate:nucleotide phosphotransferase
LNKRDFVVKPGSKVNLRKIDPDDTGEYKDSGSARARTEKNIEKIAKLQEKLYAESRQALLVILQGMDTSGKDGVTKSFVRDVNPPGVVVTSFKVPSKEELSHDFLWRAHLKVPSYGLIGVWNRSHYEDVLVVRVHELVPEKVWKERFWQINEFERMLSENHVRVLKIFLHITKEEQKERLEARLKDDYKHWKFNPGDLKERAYWDVYQRVYEDAITKTSTEHAPWYVVPADKKWYRDAVATEIVMEVLEDMEPEFPKADFDPAKIKVE